MQATLSRRAFARRVYRRNRTCKKTVMSGRIRGPADYESGGQEFESLRARHSRTKLDPPDGGFPLAITSRSSTLRLPLIRISASSTSTWSMTERM
jgi:hypothetical protein